MGGFEGFGWVLVVLGGFAWGPAAGWGGGEVGGRGGQRQKRISVRHYRSFLPPGWGGGEGGGRVGKGINEFVSDTISIWPRAAAGGGGGGVAQSAKMRTLSP